MPSRPKPSSPVDAYKQIIDQLVRRSTSGVHERLVRESGIYLKSPVATCENELVASLSNQQREVLATMLRQERVSAIHDVLAELTWWLLCREVGLTFRGEPMPFELSGMGMHGDFVGRLDNWEWPAEENSN
jgi:hypothetical protein